jgi:hypothetical protein
MSRFFTPIQLGIQQHGTDGVLGSLSKGTRLLFWQGAPLPTIRVLKTLLVFNDLELS